MISGISEPARSRHSTLYLWMRRNHAEISEQIALHGVHWPDVAVALGKDGLTDRTGKPPTANTCKQTWYRVAKAAAAPPKPKPPASNLRPGEIAPGVWRVSPSPPPATPPAFDPFEGADYEPPPRPRLRPAKLRD